MNTVYVVTGHDETWVFDDEELAEQFASIRGGCEWETCEIINSDDALQMIDSEIKERRDEERMRQAGL